MMSLKETKRISGVEGETLTLSAAPTIHVGGSIVNPVSNETISIMIPLSAQLSKITSSRMIAERSCKVSDDKDDKISDEQLQLSLQQSRSPNIQHTLSVPISHVLAQQSISSAVQQVKGKAATTMGNQFRADKTKGCPFPTCSRYGRAFSRAHDLKRHIARHETRKERPVEVNTSEIPTCAQCGESFLNEAILQRHARLHAKPGETIVENLEFQPNAPVALVHTAGDIATETTRGFPCNLCKKKYSSQSKLKAHVLTHAVKTERSVCGLCGCEFDQEDKLQEHMREHTTSILQAQEALSKSTDKSTQVKEEDDDFMLEEMLLLNKNPRINTSGATVSSTSTSTSSSSSRPSNNSKIRCDYCSKTFKTKWTLSSHVAAHEGRFQFCCTRCGKKFVRKSHFEGHVRSHEAARPYVCEQCGKTFKELKHRREHTKRKHPGNSNAIQNLLDSISACVSEDSSVDQAKFTLLMPINFGA